ncbi:MAG: class I SAM-dependent methyltransferase [Planctomycetota bacterium]
MGDKHPQIDRESSFHDEWARRTRPEQVKVNEAFEAPTAMENLFILEMLGDLRGKKLLDVGAGLGESSVYFALRGAQVTATDIAPAMTQFAEELARHHNTHLTTIIAQGEELDLEPESYDIIHAANIIHHLADKEAFFAGIRRGLKPGGVFVSWDPLKYNPVINVYRRLATKVRTEDERPLSYRDVSLARKYFADLRTRHFWLLSQAIFLKYFLLDRVDPNRERYWKRIYSESGASLRWWMPLRALDRVLLRIPGLKWLSWNIVMYGHKRSP